MNIVSHDIKDETESKTDRGLKLIDTSHSNLRLMVLSGNHQGESVELGAGPVIVGDHEGCQLPLTDLQLKGVCILVEKLNRNTKVTIKKGNVNLYLVDESGKAQVKVDESAIIEEGEVLSINGIRIELRRVTNKHSLSEDSEVSLAPVDNSDQMTKADLLDALYLNDKKDIDTSLPNNDSSSSTSPVIINGGVANDRLNQLTKRIAETLNKAREYIKNTDPRYVFGALISVILICVIVAYSLLGQPRIEGLESNEHGENGISVIDKNLVTGVAHSDPPMNPIEARQLKNAEKNILNLKSEFKRMLLDRELSTKLQLNVDDKGLVVTGIIKDKDVDILNRMLARLKKEQGIERLAIKLDVKNNRVELPFIIKQVSSGKYGSILLENGRRVFLGEEVDGFQLIAIDNDYIVFLHDGAKTKFPW